MLSTTAVLFLIVLFVFHNSIATADTLITFPNVSPHDDFFTLEDAAYDPNNRSYIISAGDRTLASRGSCGVLRYGKKVRIPNVATGRVASFSSSFSFTFTTHGVPWDIMNNILDGSKFVFAMTQNVPMATWDDMFSQYEQFGACKISRNQDTRLRPPIFSIEFDTDYNLNRDKEPSNKIIRISQNLDYKILCRSIHSGNLCGNDTHCSYFSDGRIFTAWIDFTSSSQTLEFRMASKSNPKPVQPLMLVSNYKFPRWIGDEVVLSLSGGSDVNHLEEHEFLSWNFLNTGISESKFQLMLQTDI